MTDWKEQILSNLNEPQQQAVQTVRGPLLILAGAGSGKTRTIIHRMAYIIHVEKGTGALPRGGYLHQQSSS
jgi:DNA helicase-2/ATP-dependent DNA helicase PcrA